MKFINKTLLLASAIGLTLASGVVLAQTAGYLSIKDVEVEIKTSQDIPVDGKSGAFGYAVLTDGAIMC